jgi:hypothetical protein
MRHRFPVQIYPKGTDRPGRHLALTQSLHRAQRDLHTPQSVILKMRRENAPGKCAGKMRRENAPGKCAGKISAMGLVALFQRLWSLAR